MADVDDPIPWRGTTPKTFQCLDRCSDGSEHIIDMGASPEDSFCDVCLRHLAPEPQAEDRCLSLGKHDTDLPGGVNRF